jgi:hypothetical protein
MEIKVAQIHGTEVASVKSGEAVIKDVNSALDLIATIQHETGAHRIAINKEAVSEDFFELRTGLAGNILQKCVNYRMKLAVYGDFGAYSSKALKDFITECNRGRDFYFLPSEEEAMEALAGAK